MIVHSNTDKSDKSKLTHILYSHIQGVRKFILNVIFYRERERQHHRDELWLRVESLAQQSPAYEMIRPQLIDSNNSSESPEQNEELTFESLEKEAQEVCS